MLAYHPLLGEDLTYAGDLEIHDVDGHIMLGRFSGTLSDVPAADRRKFFSRNIERVIPLASDRAETEG